MFWLVFIILSVIMAFIGSAWLVGDKELPVTLGCINCQSHRRLAGNVIFREWTGFKRLLMSVELYFH